MRKRTIKEQASGREKMATDIAFRFLMIVGGREARNQKGVPQVRSARKEAIRKEYMVASS